jgi:hypothetical protein
MCWYLGHLSTLRLEGRHAEISGLVEVQESTPGTTATNYGSHRRLHDIYYQGETSANRTKPGLSFQL